MRIIFIMAMIVACVTTYAKDLQITATSWLVADGYGNTIESQKSTEQRSIASISKLMTVLVVLDAKQNLKEILEKNTREDTIQLALVRSDNHAADLLCTHYLGGRNECIKAMNLKAASLGMIDTHFVEPTGLSVFNVSTANDLVKLVITVSKYEEVRKAAVSPQVKIHLKKKWLIFNNTNPIIGKKYNFIVSKTGYIRASGGCIALMVDTDIGRRIVVVLGSKNTHTRIPEAEFIFENY